MFPWRSRKTNSSQNLQFWPNNPIQVGKLAVPRGQPRYSSLIKETCHRRKGTITDLKTHHLDVEVCSSASINNMGSSFHLLIVLWPCDVGGKRAYGTEEHRKPIKGAICQASSLGIKLGSQKCFRGRGDYSKAA